MSGEKSFADFYVGGMDEKAFEEALKSDSDQITSYVKSHLEWSAGILKLKPGQTAVVANGKVIKQY